MKKYRQNPSPPPPKSIRFPFCRKLLFCVVLFFRFFLILWIFSIHTHTHNACEFVIQNRFNTIHGWFMNQIFFVDAFFFFSFIVVVVSSGIEIGFGWIAVRGIDFECDSINVGQISFSIRVFFFSHFPVSSHSFLFLCCCSCFLNHIVSLVGCT